MVNKMIPLIAKMLHCKKCFFLTNTINLCLVNFNFNHGNIPLLLKIVENHN